MNTMGGYAEPDDARYRAELDMFLHSDNTHISNGEFGKADYIELIVKNFPEFWEGGAIQPVINITGDVKKVVDVETVHQFLEGWFGTATASEDIALFGAVAAARPKLRSHAEADLALVAVLSPPSP